MMALEGCAPLGEQAQSFTNQEVTCALSGTDFVRAVWLLRDTERHSFPLLCPPPPAFPCSYILSLIIF